jgi:hypothetical protein
MGRNHQKSDTFIRTIFLLHVYSKTSCLDLTSFKNEETFPEKISSSQNKFGLACLTYRHHSESCTLRDGYIISGQYFILSECAYRHPLALYPSRVRDKAVLVK